MPRPSRYHIYALCENDNDILYIGKSTRRPNEWYWGIRSAGYGRRLTAYLKSNPDQKFTVKLLASFKYERAQLSKYQVLLVIHAPKYNIPLNCDVKDKAPTS
jgi:hypothetical protein